MKRALITGITGQDGSYLAELLLAKGYEVHGTIRPSAFDDSRRRLWRIQGIYEAIQPHAVALEDRGAVLGLLRQVRPEEVYHLAAQSFVGYAPEEEAATLQANIAGTHAVFSAVKAVCPEARCYFAASSEMFGRPMVSPQNEATPFHPRSAYGISKCAGFHLAQVYRHSHGLFAAAGILFNHESPRRGVEFVTRKISCHVALIVGGKAVKLKLGDLEARRDWGHAKRYVEAIWRMLQAPEPDDFVVATGRTHSVREFCEIAFRVAGLDYRDHVESDPSLCRPSDGLQLVGDATKARVRLGWTHDVDFAELVSEMVESDLAQAGELTEQFPLTKGVHGRRVHGP